jgi:transcriptional regulator of acetoin/glycerol metabolism
MERGFILQVLRENNWNRKAAARELGIGRQTLWRKIKRLNIQIPRKDGCSLKNKN